MNDESEKSVDGLLQPSQADGNASKLITNEQYIAAAYHVSREEEVEIDHDEKAVIRGEDGAWVRAWVFVDDDDVDVDEDEDIELVDDDSTLLQTASLFWKGQREHGGGWEELD